jgi:hypothetical protein
MVLTLQGKVAKQGYMTEGSTLIAKDKPLLLVTCEHHTEHPLLHLIHHPTSLNYGSLLHQALKSIDGPNPGEISHCSLLSITQQYLT